MKTQTLLKVFFAAAVCVQGTAQAVNATELMLGTATAAVAYAGWRAADKDPKPIDQLVTSDVIQKQGLDGLKQFVDERVIGQDEQGSTVTDYKPVYVINEKPSDWAIIHLKDAKTGAIVPTYHRIAEPAIEKVHLPKGDLPYCKSTGVGRIRKEFKKVNLGLATSTLLYGSVWLTAASYNWLQGNGFKIEDTSALAVALTKLRRTIGSVALISSGLGAICPTK